MKDLVGNEVNKKDFVIVRTKEGYEKALSATLGYIVDETDKFFTINKIEVESNQYLGIIPFDYPSYLSGNGDLIKRIKFAESISKRIVSVVNTVSIKKNSNSFIKLDKEEFTNILIDKMSFLSNDSAVETFLGFKQDKKYKGNFILFGNKEFAPNNDDFYYDVFIYNSILSNLKVNRITRFWIRTVSLDSLSKERFLSIKNALEGIYDVMELENNLDII